MPVDHKMGGKSCNFLEFSVVRRSDYGAWFFVYTSVFTCLGSLLDGIFESNRLGT
jgi:hypothetical protein